MAESFSIVPASARALWFLGAVGVVLLVLLAVFAYTAYSSRHTRFEIGETSLRIRGDLWARSIPLSALALEGARVIDLAATPALRPRFRVGGTGLPGYRSGWFTLRNGEKALLYVTDTSRVAYVPTGDGYSILLSVAKPQDFLDALARALSRRD